MTIYWPLMLVAAVLLWTPAFLPSPMNRRLSQGRRIFPPTVVGMLRAWPNWLDAARAGAGTYLLTGPALTVDPQAAGAEFTALCVRFGVLALGLLIQTVRFKTEVVFLSPIFYLCGLTLVLPGYEVGGFAVFVGWLFAAGGKNPAYQLPAMGVAAAAGGYFLSGLNLPLMMAVALIFLPPVLGQLFRKPLVFVAQQRETA